MDDDEIVPDDSPQSGHNNMLFNVLEAAISKCQKGSSHKNLHNEKSPQIFKSKRKSRDCEEMLTRQQIIEMEELKECAFKPTIDEVSKILANKRKDRRDHNCIEEALIDDAIKRCVYKQKIQKAVIPFL